MEPKFLSNKPVGKDLFEGKSQEKTANTLCNILSKKDFQVIGIDGGWGTGKSNLVSIVEERLKSKGFYFFIYDVWGHQEDEQRRAILEELTEKVCENNILANKAKWREKLSKLLAKEREITTINRPYLGIGIVFTLFSIIYVPTITVFLKDLPATFSKWGMSAFLWKIFIVGFPLLLVLLTYLWHLLEQLFWKKEKGKSFKIALQKTFQVYNNKQIDETKIETISENEPTVKDFRNWMNEIDTDLNGKKLVLVFDNFDRLPQKHILSLWSSIHVFFAEEKYNNIKVIIPFDRQHIQNAFKDLDYEKETTDETKTNKKDNYSEDYINKTFDIVYRVSPPILSNWKNYFKEKWVGAFGNADDEDYERVVQLYEIFTETITPREIIVFINEIVALELLFNEQIPKQYFALFILNKDILLQHSLREITEPTYLAGASYLYKNDEDLPKFITAIIYQINPESAIEVIYKKQLKSALVNKDFEKFKEIASSSFLSDTIDGAIAELNNIEFPIETLDTLPKESGLTEHKLNLVWKKLYSIAKDYSYTDFDLPPYQKILFKHIGSPENNLWLKSIVDSLYRNTKFEAAKFSDIIEEIDSFATENGIVLDVFNFLSPHEVSTNLFIDLVSKRKAKFTEYRLSCNEDDLISFLGGLDTVQLENADYIKYLKEYYDLDLFIKALQEKIRQNSTDKIILGVLFNRLKEITDTPIVDLLPDPQLYTLFTQSTEKEDFYFDLIALRIARLNEFHPTYAPTFNAILNSDNEDIADEVAERIKHYMNCEDLLMGSISLPNHKLFQSVCRKVITNANSYCAGNFEKLLLNFDVITNQIKIDPKIFIHYLDRSDINIEQNNVIQYPLYLYEEITKDSSHLSISILQNAEDYFQQLDKESWVEIFDNLDFKTFELLKIISFKRWNSYASDGLKESLLKVVTSGDMENKEEWEYLFSSFSSAGSSLINLLKDVRDKFYNDSNLMDLDFFSFFVKYFLANGICEDKPGDAFRTIFKSEFLDDDNSLTLMIDNSEALKLLVTSSNQSEVSDFKQAIRDRKDNSPLIGDLAKRLDIRSSKK